MDKELWVELVGVIVLMVGGGLFIKLLCILSDKIKNNRG